MSHNNVSNLNGRNFQPTWRSRVVAGVEVTPPQVTIAAEAMAKMQFYADNVRSEVSGYGLVIQQEDDVLHIPRIYLPRQRCSGGSTDIDPEAGTELMMLVMEEFGPDAVSAIKIWWHTHYNFNVYWSGTDDRNIEEYAGSGTDWYLSIVINQRGDLLARYDLFRPHRIVINDIPVKVIYDLHETTQLDLLEELDEKVEVFVPPPVTNSSKGKGQTPPAQHWQEGQAGYSWFDTNGYYPEDNENGGNG